jgi:hypothetical protein
MLGYQQGTNNTDNDRLMIGNSAAHAIIDGTMGIDHASCVLRLKADTIVLGNSLPIAFNASEPQAVWVSDSTLRRGNYVPSGGGIVETEGYFLKSTNNYVWYSDEFIIMSWDGFDEVFVKHTGAAGIPADVYATSHLHTNSVSFPSSNPMIVTTVDQDFLQRSSAFFSDFTIRSDSNATAFPYYKVHFEVSGSSGTTYCYWTVKRYPI